MHGSASNITQTAAYKLHSETDGAPPIITWFDKQGREIKVKTKSADGRDVFMIKGYNAIALQMAASEPHFFGDTPVYTFTEYDSLGREQFVRAPDGTVSEMVYEGLTTIAIRDSDQRSVGETAKHQMTTTLKNAKGEVLSVMDAMSNTVTYVYDPVGNLLQTIDPENNVIEMRYDIRGNKWWQDDPDMGVWSYTYNALDQLTAQTDANSNRIETAYDVLGRATARTNQLMTAINGLQLESTAEWFYDGVTEGDKLGMLRLEEHRDGNGDLINRKRYTYDQYSRPMLELMNYDQKWYYTAIEYDAYSRVEKTHRYWRPKGKEGIDDNLDPQWNTFVSINTYNSYGALLEVSDADNHTWWKCSASDYDQYGRVVASEYGNGLINTATYDPLTGRTTGIGISDFQSQVSNFQFQYDRIGNLTQRSQSRPLMTTLTETCTYDSLNRLLSTSLTGVTNLTTSTSYDALGNIKTRSGIGSYLYGGPRPHAVTSAAGCDYIYDNNGNIVRRDRNSSYEFTAKWNSFNKPASLFAGVKGSEFSYSVDGRRTQQMIFEDLTNVTKKVYATPAYEMKEVLTNPAETNRANWQWEMDYCRIYVDTPVGKIGIYQEEGSSNGIGDITRSYIHKDHLGSVIATSDSDTNITFYSYDAWGNRRDADDGSPMSSDLRLSTFKPSTLPTDRGFTGHEQLDHLALIHMNGRIYDPVIARVISPDPIIQEPNNLQSFNRYTYVMNRPLSLADPSGFTSSGLDRGLGSARSSGGGGGDEGYVEPIQAAPISEIGSIQMQSGRQDIEIVEYEEVYDQYGYFQDLIEVVTTITGTQGEEKLLTSGGNSSGSDIKTYGLKTGSSATLTEENQSSTGAKANDGELGEIGAKGKLVKGPDKEKDPVTEATKGGTDNPAAETLASKKAQADNKIPEISGYPSDKYDIKPGRHPGTYWVRPKSIKDRLLKGDDYVDSKGNSGLVAGVAPAIGPGGRLTGYTKHGINQAISRNGRGVSPKAILDAVRNPKTIVEQGKGAMKYVGEKATVVLNKVGKVITTWGKPR